MVGKFAPKSDELFDILALNPYSLKNMIHYRHTVVKADDNIRIANAVGPLEKHFGRMIVRYADVDSSYQI